MESLVGPARVDIMASIALIARKIDTLCASYISYRYVHTSNAPHLSLRWQSGMYVCMYVSTSNKLHACKAICPLPSASCHPL